MNFGSIDAFVTFLATATGRMHEARQGGLKEAGEIVQAEAKAEIGHYQAAAGPFDAWAPLAESTKADRVAQGFPEDEPLLRTGELRESIGIQVSGDTVHVGSDHPVAAYQEFGTRKIPPRSFIGGAMFRKALEAATAVADHEIGAMVGLPGKARPGNVSG